MKTSYFVHILFIPILSLAFQGALNPKAITVDDDRYNTKFVAEALDFFGDPPERGVWSSEVRRFTHQTPSLPQLGDGVTVASLKILGPNKLFSEKQTRAYLLIVRLAFSDRDRVTEKSDTNANATLFVLERLKEKSADAQIQKRVAYLQGCVLDFSCSPGGEYSYVTRHELLQPKPPER